MASKFFFLHMLFTLALFAVRLNAGGALPMVRFIDAVSRENPAMVSLHIKAGHSWTAKLKSGQDYELQVEVDNEVYHVLAKLGLRFTAFYAYEPGRDTGRAAVNWRAGDDGFYFSHDNSSDWKLVAPWVSE